MLQLLAGICFVAALASGVAGAATVTFNFDTAPDGSAIPNGAVLNWVYLSQGLTLSRTGNAFLICDDGYIYANNDRPADFTISSPPNVVSQCAPPKPSDVGEAPMGDIRADLASPASQVCINVRPDGPSDLAVLRAYDTSHGPLLLARVTSIPGAMQTLCVSASNILRVEFSGLFGARVRLDDLAVTYPGPPAPVPATSPLWLAAIAIGLATLAGRAVRRRR